MLFRSRLIVVLVAALGVSCAAESYQKVPRPDLSLDVSQPGVARVYVLRDDQVRGSIRSIRVYESQKEIGSIAPGDYLCWERRPGRSLLKLIYEGPVIDGGEHEALLDLELVSGQIGYCVIHLDSVGKPVAQLHSADEVVGLLESRAPAPVK
jgi:hypothetical protein